MKTLRALALLSLLAIFAISMAGPARALPILEGDFNITFNQVDPSSATWSGMFSSDAAGTVTSFMADIGDCANPSDCIYTDFLQGAPTWDGTFITGTVFSANFGALGLFSVPLQWTTQNTADTFNRFGPYSVTEKSVVPEPSSFLLMLVGLGALAGFSLRRRSRQA